MIYGEIKRIKVEFEKSLRCSFKDISPMQFSPFLIVLLFCVLGSEANKIAWPEAHMPALKTKTNKPVSNSSCKPSGIEEALGSQREIESIGAESKETTAQQRQPNAKHTKQPSSHLPLLC